VFVINYPLQNEGKKSTKTANNSSLPNSMPKDRSHFDKSDTSLKFPFGPIISPSPGPTLDIDVAAPDIADKKSSPVTESSIANSINKNK
jgi:hypothetical protein